MLIKPWRATVAAFFVAVGRMIEQTGNFCLLRNAVGSGMIRLDCKSWPTAGTAALFRSGKSIEKPVTGALMGTQFGEGIAFTGLSCQVWKCIISALLMLLRMRRTSTL